MSPKTKLRALIAGRPLSATPRAILARQQASNSLLSSMIGRSSMRKAGVSAPAPGLGDGIARSGSRWRITRCMMQSVWNALARSRLILAGLHSINAHLTLRRGITILWVVVELPMHHVLDFGYHLI